MIRKEEAEKRQKEISSLAGKPMIGIDNRTALGMESKEDARRTNIRIFEGASPMVKTYFEKDIDRLRSSLAPGKIEPKIGFAAPAETARNMAANADLRTGNVSVANLMPAHMQGSMIDSRISDYPEKTLAAAMQKLNARAKQ